jgi:E3 ubiquitin-protein ligase RNF14
MDGDDIREVELTAITAIYPPEELHVDENDRYSFTIELPVSLTKPLVVKFPAATEAARPVPLPVPGATPIDGQTGQVDSQELSNLPSLQIRFTLPEGYPQDKPPKVSISTSPPWLPERVISELESKAEKLWEDIGRDQVIFDYVDDVRQSVDDVFGLIAQDSSLEVGPEHKIAILDYDIEAKRRDFQKRTFDCGICLGKGKPFCLTLLCVATLAILTNPTLLDPKKGSVCHRMLDCGHVFCVQCLQDFYNNAITEGDVASIQCLEPNCAAKREKAAREKAGPGRKSKLKTFISPSELLQIPLDHDMVKRFVTLKHKTELESDKNTVYCPRAWCQGAARSKRHKKPEGLEFVEASEDESDDEQPPQPGAKITRESVNRELLAICEDCGFAFCSRCGQSWHGEFKYCIPKERKDEITEEEKASLEYLKMHTTPCPTCAAPCQKTQGCNHMRCFKCQTHFCYLCSAWLNPENPYQHFNVQPSGAVNSCFMRLWELEGGDGNDVGIEYLGGGAARNANAQPGENVQPLEVVQQDHQNNNAQDAQPEAAAAPGRNEPARRVEPQQDAPRADEQPQPDERRVGVAREGPLVLRIDGDAPAPAAAAAAPAQPPVAVPMNARGGRMAAANNAQRGRGGAGGGNRGGRPPRGHGHAGRPNNGRAQGQAQQNQNQRPNRDGRNNNNRNIAVDRRAGQPPVRRRANEDWDEEEVQMNQADEQWIRNFVHLALNDQEHLIDGGDSSGDEAN